MFATPADSFLRWFIVVGGRRARRVKINREIQVSRKANQPTCVCCAIRKIPLISEPADVSVDSRPPTIWIWSACRASHQKRALDCWDVLTSAISAFVAHRVGFHPRGSSLDSLKCSAIHRPSLHFQSWWVVLKIVKYRHVLLGYPFEPVEVRLDVGEIRIISIGNCVNKTKSP